eukprot:COSAG01_NODE_34777_length_542_cov_0.993228_2_plen_93_part_00
MRRRATATADGEDRLRNVTEVVAPRGADPAAMASSEPPADHLPASNSQSTTPSPAPSPAPGGEEGSVAAETGIVQQLRQELAGVRADAARER